MDIRELLEQRKRELYGENEAVFENMGDITGEFEDELYDEAEYIPEGLNEQDMLDIELEANSIEDPDAYIEEATDEFNNDVIALAGEMYIDELIVEEALFDCDTLEDLEVVEESIKENVKEKADKAVAKVKEMWKKFKAWILNLKNVVVNMFASGAKLVEKNKQKIVAEYNRRGDKIKLKSYNYHLDVAKAKGVVNSIAGTATSMVGGDAKVADTAHGTVRNVAGGRTLGEGKLGHKDVKTLAARCVRNDKKEEMTVKDLNINDVMQICADKKEVIKAMNQLEKDTDKKFKECINKIKQHKPASDDKDAKKDNKDMIGANVKFIKQVNAIVTSFIKAFINEVKAANRACAAIIRRLLNQGTAGGDTETKLHKKIDERR